MAHGSQCGCAMCSVGKKMGMIKGQDGPKTCAGCGHEHEEDGKCACGCG